MSRIMGRLPDKIYSWWRATSKPSLAEWFLVGSLLALAYVTFLYGDVRATFEHSMNFMDALFSGRITDFYEIAIDHTSTGHPAVYDIPLYFIFGVWNLPAYLLHHFKDYQFLESTPLLLWLKLMMVVCAAVSAKLVADIARLSGVGAERARWAAFYFISSIAVIVPVFVIVQYDILLVMVMLFGIRAYIRENDKAFLAWFALANTLKLFAIFVFIPLLLLKHKRLVVVAGQLVVGMSALIACRLLYHGNVAYQASTGGFSDSMFERLVATGIRWQNDLFSTQRYTIGLFVVTMILVCVFAYLRHVTLEQLAANTIYIGLVVFVSFMVFVPLNPYWIVLMAPFTCLIIFINPRFFFLNVLVESAMSAALFILYILVGYPIYNLGIFKDLAFPRISGGAFAKRFNSPNEIFELLGIGKYTSFLVAFVFAAAVLMLVLNFPSDKLTSGIGTDEERVARSAMWFHMAMPAAFVTLLFAIYYLPAPVVAYNSTTATPVLDGGNLLASDARVREEIHFDADIEVEGISIGISAGSVSWIDSSFITLRVLDSSGKAVSESTVPANSIGVSMFKFEMDEFVLKANELYTVELTSSHIEGGTASVFLNSAVNNFRTVVGDKEIQGDLEMQIFGKAK